MADFKTLAGISNLLTERYGERGKAAAERLQLGSGRRAHGLPRYPGPAFGGTARAAALRCLLAGASLWHRGRRGRVGYGSNRFNPTTVAMTVQGHCNYLAAAFPGKGLSVIVANDVRVFNDFAGVYRFLGSDHPLLGTSSRSIAKLACEIYAGNGVVAYLAEPEADQSLLSTPELSFIIRKLQAAGRG